MIRAIEHLGISMVFGEEYFGRGDLDHTSYLNFVTNDALGQDFLNASKSFAYWIKDRYVVARRGRRTRGQGLGPEMDREMGREIQNTETEKYNVFETKVRYTKIV